MNRLYKIILFFIFIFILGIFFSIKGINAAFNTTNTPNTISYNILKNIHKVSY